MCLSGICTCNSTWTGPACDGIFFPAVLLYFFTNAFVVPITPINVTANSTSPTIDVNPNKGTDGTVVSFSVSLQRIDEVSESNEVLHSVQMDSGVHNITLDTSTFGSNTKNIFWVYSSALSNGATVNVTVSVHKLYFCFSLTFSHFLSFEDFTTPYTFANRTTVFPAHTLKLNVKISSWPFNSIRNSLSVVMETLVSTTAETR